VPDGPADATPPAQGAEAERLRAIGRQIEELRARLLDTDREAGDLVDALDELDLTMALLSREAVLLESDIAAATRAEAAARREAEAARVRVTASEADLRAWLVTLYKTGPTPGVRFALLASTPEGLGMAARAAERLAVSQGRRVTRLRSERDRQEAAVRAHQAALDRLTRLGVELQSKREALAASRQSKGTLLDTIRTRQSVGRDALSGLVRVETDLQALLQTLGPEGAAPGVSRGLPRFKGLLNWPTEGPVALGFGNVRHPKFNTEVPHPGIEISCHPGGTVRALYDGKVVYSDWFRGYGQMIVIDHGDEYLSIYGQLGDRLVEAGSEVDRDAPIAHTGGEGTFGVTGLYFELRHKGQAEDPRPWLRRMGGTPPRPAGEKKK
jgi:septal ring factor EnvC (AmiA/AmiB activator)